jgi:DNA-directed RNA polymerase subunit RPC12/RpoP
MSDFISMTCPSCGGHIQIENNLQKFFCNHCGTELLLKQDAEGILTPIKARDLQASAKLKEIQFSMTAMELLKSQIAELENQIKNIRATFLEYYPKVYSGAWNSRYFIDYEKEKKLPIKLKLEYVPNCQNWNTYIEKNIPGYTTAEELIEFSQFMQRPQYRKDKYVTTMLAILEPLPPLAEQLKQKKAQLNRMLEQAIDQGD